MTLNVDTADAARQASSPPTERVIDIMEMLGSDPSRQFSLAEISRRLGISRATGHAIMVTLTARDWVRRDPGTAKYSWGNALTGLAGAGAYRARLDELATLTGTQVYLARREDDNLVIVDVAGPTSTAPPIVAGMRTPLVAPFGRDYIAWSDAAAQQSWLEAIGQPSDALRTRISQVLKEIRARGFVVERLTREYLRVYTALRALSEDGEVDAITAQLARAFADLSVIDVLPDELVTDTLHNIATVSAPITGSAVPMSLTAAPFSTLDAAEITRLGEQVKHAAARIVDAVVVA